MVGKEVLRIQEFYVMLLHGAMAFESPEVMMDNYIDVYNIMKYSSFNILVEYLQAIIICVTMVTLMEKAF